MIRKAPYVFKSYAKINLGLIIKGKREDGYHLLETLFYPLKQLYDTMEFQSLEEPVCEIQMKGIEEEIPLEKNLCYMAWDRLRAEYPQIRGIRIRIDKKIPAGAGLGGGSSNAATTLLALSHLYEFPSGKPELASLGEELGADVPFFIFNEPMFASGIGTELEFYDLKLPYRIELITPPIFSSTPEAYKGLDWSQLNTGDSLKTILERPVEDWKEHLRNDLERPVFKRFPELAQIKEDLYRRGAVFASMTGSGSAMFGLFPE